MKKGRVLKVVTAVALAALVLSGCKGKGGDKEAAASVQEDASGGETSDESGEETSEAKTSEKETSEESGSSEAGSEGESESETEDESQYEGVSVVVAMDPSSEPEGGFDPVYGWGAGEHVHEPLIQSTLTVTNKDLTIGKDLATDISTSEDGLSWTVKIRGDVKFSDGEALTASDVAFTYNQMRDTSSVNEFTMLEEATASDDTTVVFRLNRPYSIWPYTMATVGIVPEHAYGSGYGEHPVGSGRYLMKQWDRGQQVIFTANPDYYGEAPKMKKVTVLFMEEDAAFAAVKAGTADLAYTSASYSDQKVDGYELLAFETVDNRGINLPFIPVGSFGKGQVSLGNDFTSNSNVRRAINIGINRDELIEHVLNGYGSPAYSVCDKMPWYNEASKVAYDPEKAGRLLDAVGWTMGEDGIRQQNGRPANMPLLYSAGDSVRQALAMDVANQLKQLGIEVEVEGVGWDTAYDQAQSKPMIWGWGAHTPMELYNIYHTAENSKYARYSPYANHIVDEYMDEAVSSNSLEESYELWKKSQWDGKTGITQEGDIPWVWLVNIDHLYWSKNGLRVAEQKIHPHGHGWSIVNNVDQWTWE